MILAIGSDALSVVEISVDADRCTVSVTRCSSPRPDELTRDGIYRALEERRCFATTGETLALRTRVAGTPMGSTVETAVECVDLNVEGRVPERLLRVEILRDNEIVRTVEPTDARIDESVALPLDGGITGSIAGCS